MDWKRTPAGMALVLLGCAQQSASAADWQPLRLGDPDVRWAVDGNTIARNGDMVRACFRIEQKSQSNTDGSWSSVQRLECDCARRTVRSLGVTIYDRSGAFVQDLAAVQDTADIVPGSIGEALLQALCSPQADDGAPASPLVAIEPPRPDRGPSPFRTRTRLSEPGP